MPLFITMVISWYLVFFTPKDLFTQFLLKTRVTFIFSMAQDFQRLHLCLAGVNAVAKIHPQAFFYMIFIGGKIFLFFRKQKTIAYCLFLITSLNVCFQFCFFIVSERLPGFVCTNNFPDFCNSHSITQQKNYNFHMCVKWIACYILYN